MGRPRRFGLPACLLSVMLAGAGPAVPRPGEVRRLTAVTVALRSGSTQEDTRRVTYTPPPGWFVRTHAVRCVVRKGRSSYTVSTVPSGWTQAAEESDADSSRRRLEAEASSGGAGGRALAVAERSDARTRSARAAASHHALVVEATARGEGLFRAGGELELTVEVELVYVGDPGP
jgi:hypothetical protein